MDMLAKIANNYNIHTQGGQPGGHSNSRSSSPTPNTPNTNSPKAASSSSSSSSSSSPTRTNNSTNNNNHTSGNRNPSAMFQSTSGGAGEDYELLSTSPKVVVARSSNNNGPSSSSAGLSSVTEELPKRPKLPERILRPRGQPLSRVEWLKCFAADGSVSEGMAESVKRKIFEGGCEEEVRADVWRLLLGYDRWGDSLGQRELQRAQRKKEYYGMKSQWLLMSAVQEDHFSDYRDRKCQIQKDVKRTDRTHEFYAGDDNPNVEALYEILMTYVMYNFDLGYVQVRKLVTLTKCAIRISVTVKY